jgi:hypothetical protein
MELKLAQPVAKTVLPMNLSLLNAQLSTILSAQK